MLWLTRDIVDSNRIPVISVVVFTFSPDIRKTKMRACNDTSANNIIDENSRCYINQSSEENSIELSSIAFQWKIYNKSAGMTSPTDNPPHYDLSSPRSNCRSRCEKYGGSLLSRCWKARTIAAIGISLLYSPDTSIAISDLNDSYFSAIKSHPFPFKSRHSRAT